MRLDAANPISSVSSTALRLIASVALIRGMAKIAEASA